MESLSIIIDSRERNDTIIDGLRSAGVLIKEAMLPVGDYALSDRVCIERKTIQDFESSIINGRLFEQLARLHDAYECPMLLIEGDEKLHRLHGNVINGTIASIYIDYKILVVYTSDPKGTAEILHYLLKHELDSKISLLTYKGSARVFTSDQYKERIVGNIPGVGPLISKRLLERFGSIRAIANASTEELMAIDKIGEAKAGRIRDALSGEYNKQ